MANIAEMGMVPPSPIRFNEMQRPVNPNAPRVQIPLEARLKEGDTVNSQVSRLWEHLEATRSSLWSLIPPDGPSEPAADNGLMEQLDFLNRLAEEVQMLASRAACLVSSRL
jgi:hypothetical protein